MAEVQTRKSISVSRTCYDKLKTHCEANDISMSGFVEKRIQEQIGPTPKATRCKYRYPSCQRNSAPTLEFCDEHAEVQTVD